MSRHSILSNAQREAILTAQFDLDEREVARYWTLSDQDLLRIDRRRDSNRFGFAVQLCLLRFPGWPPKRRDRMPLPLLLYVAEQLGIQTDNIEEYFRRQPTRSEHLQGIIDLYGFRYYDEGVVRQKCVRGHSTTLPCVRNGDAGR
jgi:TnpA family transposase